MRREGAARLLFVVNVDWFFISHRLPIAVEARRLGYEVHVATTITNGLETLQAAGLIVHGLSIDRSTAGPLSAIRLLIDLVKLFRIVRPDVVHLVTIKPVLLGGIAAGLVRIPAVVAAVSGLGFVFVSKGFTASVRRWLVGALYRLALAHRRSRVVFQNQDDARVIRGVAKLSDDQIVLIPGSGVDLTRYRPAEPRSDRGFAPVFVVMVARLLRDKGVVEYFNAARQLRRRCEAAATVRFVLVGATDSGNPASLLEKDILRLSAAGVVECWGHRDDVAAILREADIVVLPSYREGMPKVLLEAAACGKPVITTNVPGCRDAIRPNETGLLVEPQDAEALAEAIYTLVGNRSLRETMGRAGRELAEQLFDLKKIVAQHIEIYEGLLHWGVGTRDTD